MDINGQFILYPGKRTSITSFKLVPVNVEVEEKSSHTSGWTAAKLHNKGLSGKHVFVFFFILVTVNHTHFILSETENTHTSVSLMLTYSQGLSPNCDDLYHEKLLIVVNLVLCKWSLRPGIGRSPHSRFLTLSVSGCWGQTGWCSVCSNVDAVPLF